MKGPAMKSTCTNIIAALTVALASVGCSGTNGPEQTAQTSSAGAPAARAGSKQVTFTDAVMNIVEFDEAFGLAFRGGEVYARG